MIGKRKRATGLQGDMDDVKDFFANTDVEEVPETEIQAKKDLKAKALVEQQRTKKMDESDDEKL